MKKKKRVIDRRQKQKRTKQKIKKVRTKQKIKKVKTKQKIKKAKTKKRKTKKGKTKKMKSGTRKSNSAQYKRQKQLEKLFNEQNIRNILPKNLRIFSWMTPKLFKKFNSIENIENSKIYEMSHPGG